MRVRLKGKQVGSKKAFQKFFAMGQDGEDFRGRERYVQKETDSSVRKALAQHVRQEHQVVIVNPNQIVRPVPVDYCLTKYPVRFDVGLPVPGVKFQLGGEIVKYRPERLVGVAFIESRRHIFRQIDRKALLRSGPLGENRLTLRSFLSAAVSGPTDPFPTRPAEQWVHGACQAPGTSHRVPPLPGLLQGERKPVRDDDDPSAGRRFLRCEIENFS